MAIRTSVIGTTGLKRQGNDIYEEWHRALKGRRKARQFTEMRDNDPTIGASFFMIISLLRQVPWHAEPADESEGAVAEGEFLEGIFDDMSHTWDNTVSEIATMLHHGWAFHEKLWKTRVGPEESDPTRRSKFSDGRIGLRGIPLRGQESLDGWEWDDEDGSIEGMWQLAAPDFDRVFIPMEKAVLFRTEATKNNPEGRSLLRNAWRPWFYLKRLQEIEAIGFQKEMIGTPIARVPIEYLDEDATPAQKKVVAEIQKSITLFQVNKLNGFTFPARTYPNGKETGFDLNLVEGSGKRPLDIDAAIKRNEKSIAMVTINGFMFLGMDQAGARATSTDMIDMFVTAIGSILDNIEETIDRSITQEIYELNGVPPERRARWTHGRVKKEDLMAFAQMLTKLSDGGWLTPGDADEAHVRKQIDFPERSEEDVLRDDEDVFGVDRHTVGGQNASDASSESEVDETIETTSGNDVG